MLSLKDVDTDELRTRMSSIVAQLDDLGLQLAPLLTKYSHLRLEAQEVSDELEKRGVIQLGDEDV